MTPCSRCVRLGVRCHQQIRKRGRRRNTLAPIDHGAGALMVGFGSGAGAGAGVSSAHFSHQQHFRHASPGAAAGQTECACYSDAILRYLVSHRAELTSTKTVVVLQHLLAVSEKFMEWISLSKWLQCCQIMGLQQHVTLAESTRARLLNIDAASFAVSPRQDMKSADPTGAQMSSAAADPGAGTTKLPPLLLNGKDSNTNITSKVSLVPQYIQEGVRTEKCFISCSFWSYSSLLSFVKPVLRISQWRTFGNTACIQHFVHDGQVTFKVNEFCRAQFATEDSLRHLWEQRHSSVETLASLIHVDDQSEFYLFVARVMLAPHSLQWSDMTVLCGLSKVPMLVEFRVVFVPSPHTCHAEAHFFVAMTALPWANTCVVLSNKTKQQHWLRLRLKQPLLQLHLRSCSSVCTKHRTSTEHGMHRAPALPPPPPPAAAAADFATATATATAIQQ